MGALADYAEISVINLLLNKIAFTAPDTYVGLFTVAPNDSGSGGTEVSGGSYARQRVYPNNDPTNTPKWKSAVSQGAGTHLGYLVENLQDIAFPVATANWGTIYAWGVWDALSGGNLLLHGWLSNTVKEFTVDADGVTNDDIVSPGHGFAANDRVIFRGGSLPTGLSADTVYYVISAGLTSDNFRVSTSEGGAAVNLTAVGRGEVWKVDYKVVNNNDQFKFLADQFDVIVR